VNHLRSLIRPADIDDLFTRLGAKSQSLDPSVAITPIPLQGSSTLLLVRLHSTDACDRNHPRLRAEGRLRSHFNPQVVPRNCRLVSHSNTYLLIYQGSQNRRLAEDTQERVVLLLLRLTLDLSLTADFMISSELQWTINAVLDPDTFTDINGEDLVSFFYSNVSSIDD
jgi:hypothetical protein